MEGSGAPGFRKRWQTERAMLEGEDCCEVCSVASRGGAAVGCRRAPGVRRNGSQALSYPCFAVCRDGDLLRATIGACVTLDVLAVRKLAVQVSRALCACGC